jgi:hypothetical protein
MFKFPNYKQKNSILVAKYFRKTQKALIAAQRRRLAVGLYEVTEDEADALIAQTTNPEQFYGEEWRPFGNANWKYGCSKRAICKIALATGLEHFPLDDIEPQFTGQYLDHLADDYFSTELQPTFILHNQYFDESLNSIWLEIIMIALISRSWKLTLVLLGVFVFANESFPILVNLFDEWTIPWQEGQCGISYGGFAIHMALGLQCISAINRLYKKGPRDVFDILFPAVGSLFGLPGLWEITTLAYKLPPVFGPEQKRNILTYFDADGVSHTGHHYGMLLGALSFFLSPR